MPRNTQEHPTQARISAYFSKSPSGSSGKKRRDPSPIDLTGDDVLGPPAKKSKLTSRPLSPSPKPSWGPLTPTRPSSSSVADQWRFTPASSENPTLAVGQHSEADLTAQRERHEAFKRKLLQDNSRLLRRQPSGVNTIAENEVEISETGSPRDSGDDSDGAFKKLSNMFSNKGKKKAKAIAQKNLPPKKVVDVGPSGQPYTPLELQVLQLKKDNPGTLLMVEVGYKYKFYGNDAQVAAKELGMVSFNYRNFLVASIPTHRRDVHLKKLLAQGYRVGIVNQIETAALKKISDTKNKPFERKVTHLYTAATYVDELDSVDNLERFIPPPFMCIVEEKKDNNTEDVSIGMVSVCPSTGDVMWDQFDDTLMRIELETRLVHTRPAEILLPRKGLTEPTNRMLSHFASVSTAVDRIRTERFNVMMSYTDAFTLVSKFYTDKKKLSVASESFKSGKLMAAITDFPKLVVIALAHTIKHLSAFNIADAFLETQFFDKFTTRAHMLLAANTLTNLEIYRNETDNTSRGSLMWILDKTKTKFGARLLRSWVGKPLIDKRVLQDRVDAVEEILSSASEKLATLRQTLKGLPDLARGLCRIQYGQCTPQELTVLLPAFNKIAVAFEPVTTPTDVGFKSTLLNEIISSLPRLKEPIEEILQLINLKRAAEGRKDTMWTDTEKYPGIVDSDMAIQMIEVELAEEMKHIRKLLKMPSLQWVTIAGDEYLVEVKKSEKRPIPPSWPTHSKTKFLERYQPPKVKQKLDERAQYQELLEAESNKAFSSFLEEISRKYYGVLRDAVNKLAVADCLLSFAHVALQDNYVRPQFTDEDVLEIVEGRHPMIEVLRSDPFVPNTVLIGGDHSRSKIITGPNMGGKSSSVKMVAIIAIMAQIGSYVPATSLKLGLVDSIHTRMGASDDLARGRSTFMVEMSETSEILHSATSRSLVILDELGRGTATFDGMAIANAVLQHLVETTKCKTLFITHYPLVASNLQRKFPREVENLHMSYESETRIDGTRNITFLYRLTTGMASESFGVECGRLAGLPEKILEVASEYSSRMQKEVEEKIKRNRIRKAVRLLNQCLHKDLIGFEAAVTINELHTVVEALSISKDNL